MVPFMRHNLLRNLLDLMHDVIKNMHDVILDVRQLIRIEVIKLHCNANQALC